MKKTTILTTLAFVFVLLFSVQTNAQNFAKLDKSPLDIAYYKPTKDAAPQIKIIYSRPQLNGRDLSTLVPNGKVWRTGANETTEIQFFQDVTFGGKKIKAGTYSLFTIPGATEWTIILNSDLDAWGAYTYNESHDVMRIQAPVTTGEPIDAFSIAFEKNTMYLAWGTLRVTIPFTE